MVLLPLNYSTISNFLSYKCKKRQQKHNPQNTCKLSLLKVQRQLVLNTNYLPINIMRLVNQQYNLILNSVGYLPTFFLRLRLVLMVLTINY